MKIFSGRKITFTYDGRIGFYYSRPNKGGHVHNHIYNTLYRSTFHHGPRSVGENKPFYSETLLRGLERFWYFISRGRIITKFDIRRRQL